jgi:hypothetical protein
MMSTYNTLADPANTLNVVLYGPDAAAPGCWPGTHDRSRPERPRPGGRGHEHRISTARVSSSSCRSRVSSRLGSANVIMRPRCPPAWIEAIVLATGIVRIHVRRCACGFAQMQARGRRRRGRGFPRARRARPACAFGRTGASPSLALPRESTRPAVGDLTLKINGKQQLASRG